MKYFRTIQEWTDWVNQPHEEEKVSPEELQKQVAEVIKGIKEKARLDAERYELEAEKKRIELENETIAQKLDRHTNNIKRELAAK